MPGYFCGTVLGMMIGLTPSETIEIHIAQTWREDSRHFTVVESVAEAFDGLRRLRSEGDTRKARMLLHDGRHQIEEPVLIDSFLAGDGLFIGAADGSEPVLSGGRVIRGLAPHEDGTWRTILDDVRGGEWWFEEVFAGFEPRTRARHPNNGYARVVTAGPDNRTSFTFDPSEMPFDRLDSRAEVVFLHDWSTSRVRIAGVDETTSTIKMADPIGCRAAHYAITNFEAHPRYFVEGSASLIDLPGEWSLDRESGEFVYMPMPGESIEDVKLIAPAAPALLRITGSPDSIVKNVEIHGIRFAHVNWPIPHYGYAEGQASFYEQRDKPGSDGTRDTIPAAIKFSWASGCHVDSCVITSVGGSGIWAAEGCRDCQVSDSIVRYTGANGIMVGEAASRVVSGGPWWQTAPDQVASGNRIRHCLIERCGRRFFGAVGVWVGLAEMTTIANCEIRDLPYTGVSIGWRWDETPTPCRDNLVESNEIHHVMQILSDGGCIYTLGRQPGTVLRGNAIHDVHRNAGRAPSNGIFFDQGTMGLLVEHNIFWAIDTTPIRWHWTYGNTVRENTFVLREEQRIAHYNRAKAGDITYDSNRSVDESTWSPDQAEAITRNTGPRMNNSAH